MFAPARKGRMQDSKAAVQYKVMRKTFRGWGEKGVLLFFGLF